MVNTLIFFFAVCGHDGYLSYKLYFIALPKQTNELLRYFHCEFTRFSHFLFRKKKTETLLIVMRLHQRFLIDIVKGKGKVFYCQELPSGESTTTECGVNDQQLAVIY